MFDIPEGKWYFGFWSFKFFRGKPDIVICKYEKKKKKKKKKIKTSA